MALYTGLENSDTKFQFDGEELKEINKAEWIEKRLSSRNLQLLDYLLVSLGVLKEEIRGRLEQIQAERGRVKRGRLEEELGLRINRQWYRLHFLCEDIAGFQLREHVWKALSYFDNFSALAAISWQLPYEAVWKRATVLTAREIADEALVKKRQKNEKAPVKF